MIISTKGRYALRLMIDLAMHEGNEPVRVKEIAKRQEISVKYLEQIIGNLAKGGFVKSLRGPQGGYRLAKKPKEYTVGMILRLIEGNLAPVSCLELENNECKRESQCVTLMLWRELDEAIKGVIDKYTLADLVEWQKNKINDFVI